MKKASFKIIALLMVFSTSIYVVSCKKKDSIPEPVEKPDFDTNKDDSKIESEFNDAFSIAEDAMRRNNSGMKLASDTTCSTITINTTTKLITVDFGTDGTCEGKDGRKRKGKILISYTGKYRETGTIITTTFDNYFVNDNKIEGEKVVENMGDKKYKVTVRNAKIIFTDGTAITWKADRTREWIAGYDTPFDLTDDIYTINGTSEGVNRIGKSFITTSTNIEIKLACWFQVPRVFYPVKGVKVVKNETDNKQHSIDFGTGNCDKQVTVTLNNGTIINITLD